MQINFVKEFDSFMRFAKNEGLSVRERMFGIAMLYIYNERAKYNPQSQSYEWPEGFIPVSHDEINLFAALDKRAVETIRNTLKQKGYIEFTPGMRNKRVPMYKINFLSVG